jgi:hypothetical protein
VVGKGQHARRPAADGWNAELYPQITRDELFARLPLFRGVPPDRFLTVLATGVDVTPTDPPIYCADLEKAWEYGATSGSQGPRLIMALDSSKLERTFQTLPSGAMPDEIAAVRATYPHHHPEHPDGLWFSRIDRFFPAYEIPYGYWIPGDARDALMAVFLVGDDDSWRQAVAVLRAGLSQALDSR